MPCGGFAPAPRSPSTPPPVERRCAASGPKMALSKAPATALRTSTVTCLAASMAVWRSSPRWKKTCSAVPVCACDCSLTPARSMTSAWERTLALACCTNVHSVSIASMPRRSTAAKSSSSSRSACAALGRSVRAAAEGAGFTVVASDAGLAAAAFAPPPPGGSGGATLSRSRLHSTSARWV